MPQESPAGQKARKPERSTRSAKLDKSSPPPPPPPVPLVALGLSRRIQALAWAAIFTFRGHPCGFCTRVAANKQMLNGCLGRRPCAKLPLGAD